MLLSKTYFLILSIPAAPVHCSVRSILVPDGSFEGTASGILAV